MQNISEISTSFTVTWTYVLITINPEMLLLTYKRLQDNAVYDLTFTQQTKYDKFF